ncbi:hypothetical protein [Prosthecomicrobium hirschii]|uniref:hypothetical protein n=1 Tax=Prosthecodimorpha hirschii TaxID=665126 RepID=UPI000B2C443F|nr:hypothetical protein [Prosthecomicrobium hirschii]
MSTRRRVAATALPLLFVAGTPAVAQQVEYTRVGSFAILQIYENGQFNRCSASMGPGPSMLRFAVTPAGVYTVSVPDPGIRGGPVQATFLFERGPNIPLPVGGTGGRVWFAMPDRMLQTVSAHRGQMMVDLSGPGVPNGIASYRWTLNGMTTVLTALSDCIAVSTGGGQSAAAPPRPPSGGFGQTQQGFGQAQGGGQGQGFGPAQGGGQAQGGFQGQQGGAPAGQPTGVREDYASAGPWTIEYFRRNQRGKVLFCSTTRILASETAIRFRLDGKSLLIDFMGESTGALGRQVPVAYTFSSKKYNTRNTVKGVAVASTDPEGVEWLSLSEPKGTGHYELLADADTVTIQGGGKTWRYAIGETTGPMESVMECVQKFIPS